MNLPFLSRQPSPSAAAPTLQVAMDSLPWVPLSGSKAFKPLRFLAGDRGFVELLRLEPGEAIPLHRHTGEVHAFNLHGWRELDNGERVGPGGYVYEPQGNVDSWRVVGDEALVVLVVVHGAVEYLDRDGNVTARFTASTLEDIYRRHCAAVGIAACDLTG
jgi:quercetin dioxygenase-like cupin family protein